MRRSSPLFRWRQRRMQVKQAPVHGESLQGSWSLQAAGVPATPDPFRGALLKEDLPVLLVLERPSLLRQANERRGGGTLIVWSEALLSRM
mmetsp:Transcript_17402/g.40658  ORF Transcript_17402/g.40658 Transcript_17402/m.40658 type:complete len:90 (-) Transcript_17402:39-308(-)